MFTFSFITLIVCNFCLLNLYAHDSALHELSERFVLFAQHSVVQITSGVSVPAYFGKRSINLNLGFNLNHDLPYNFSNFDPVYARDDNEVADFDRLTMYQYIIYAIDTFGLNGEECLLRMICEVSENPLYIETEKRETLLEQILHYLFTPSFDFVEHLVNHTSLEQKFLHAEELGATKGNCFSLYNCPINIIDLFTNQYY